MEHSLPPAQERTLYRIEEDKDATPEEARRTAVQCLLHAVNPSVGRALGEFAVCIQAAGNMAGAHAVNRAGQIWRHRSR